MWESYFSELHSETTDNRFDDGYNHETIDTFEFLEDKATNDNDEIIKHQFGVQEVLEVRRLKVGKAAGHDGLTSEHLKYGGVSLVYCITKLFNAMFCVRIRTFPKETRFNIHSI